MENTGVLDNRKILLSTTTIKLLAVLLMVIDHIGMAFFPDIYLFRIIGRLAFPIFVYLIVQGYFFTSNFNKYAIRLLLLALISEVPYDLFMYGEWFTFKGQNVCFSLLIILYFVRFYDSFTSVNSRFIIVTGASLLAFWLKVDYLWLGILYAIVFYFKLKIDMTLLRQLILFFLFSLTYAGVFFLQPFAVFSILLIALYHPNVKDTPNLIVNLFNRNKKYYYFFYPIQFLVLTIFYFLILKL